MTIFFSDIDCALVGSPTEELDGLKGRITASVTVSCKWEERLLLADDVLLNRREYPLITTSYAPVALTCSIVNGDEWFEATTVGQFRPPKRSLVTINYGFADTGTTAFDAVAESIEPLAEFRRLSHLPFKFGSLSGRPAKPEESPGFVEIKLRLIRRIYRMATMPAGILSNIGKVNLASYTSPINGFFFGAETLLYDAPQPESTQGSDGSKAYNVTQSLVYNPNGWNKYFDPDTATWGYYYHVSGGGAPYKSYVPADFSGIL